MTDSPLDHAIDEAVRALMNVDAPADVKARVLSRLDAQVPRGWPWLRIAAGTTLAAALLMVFVMLPGNPRVRDAPSHSRPPAAAETTTVPRPSLVANPPDRLAGRRPPAEERVVRAASVEAENAPSFEIDPLTRIDAIAIAPLEPGPIEPAALAVAPLVPIEEVQLEPLTPPRTRD